MFTLIVELNVICAQRWIQFELQNCLSTAFSTDGKTLPFSKSVKNQITTKIFGYRYVHNNHINATKTFESG